MESTSTLLSLATLKNISYVGAFFISAEYLGVTPISVEVLTLFIILDVIFGILKSGTVLGWNTVKSSVLERGIIAKLLLIFVPVMLALMGKGIGIELGYLAQGSITALILSEGYSIVGNIYSIRTGTIVQEFDAVAYVLLGIKNMLKKVITEDPPKL